MSKIRKLAAREIYDSRGNPTIEVDTFLESGSMGRASVPSGVSTGTREALELRDGDMERFFGKGVLGAVSHITKKIAPLITSMDVTDQSAIDRKMVELDGSGDKRNLGANAILGVSLSVARAAADDLKMPLVNYIGKLYGEEPNVMPVPMINVLNGGKHADNNICFQEFMIVPVSAVSFTDAMKMAAKVCQSLQSIVDYIPGNTSVGIGDDGGVAPVIRNANNDVAVINEALKLIIVAIERSGLKPQEDICIALDPASGEFFKDGLYALGAEMLTSEDMVTLYYELVKKFPIISIEDGMAEGDPDGWFRLTQELGNTVQLVGDALFVTNINVLRDGVSRGLGNAILIKANQIGSMTETLETIKFAKQRHYSTVISRRSGETEDSTIADLAVGCNAGQIKAGGMARSDRIAKYNQLVRIEEALGAEAKYSGNRVFNRGY